MEERERLEDREKERWSGRGEAQQVLSGGEIALLRIYCFKCNWVQPAPGEKNPLKSPLLRGGESVHFQHSPAAESPHYATDTPNNTI